MEEEIVQVMYKTGGPMSALSIAKAIYGEKGRASDANPYLYKMLNKGKVVAIGEGSKLWTLTNISMNSLTGVNTVKPIDKIEPIVKTNTIYLEQKEVKQISDDEILTYLRSIPDKMVTATHIARHLRGKDGRHSQVNPSLYRMLGKGLVKMCSDTKPVWSIA